jgi:hypothetical protein
MARYDQTVPLEEGDRPRSGQGESRIFVAGSKSMSRFGAHRVDPPPERAARALSPSSRRTV